MTDLEYREIIYTKGLHKFIEDNPKKTELDFLNLKVKNAQENIKKIKSETIEDYIKVTKKQHLYDENKYKSKDAYDEQILKRAEFNRGDYKNVIRNNESLIKYYEIKISLLPISKSKVKSQSNLLNGKKLNVSERYILLQKLFDSDNIFNHLNIKKEDKSKLLSLILDINIDNARKVLNGNYDSKIDEISLNKYIESLNK